MKEETVFCLNGGDQGGVLILRNDTLVELNLQVFERGAVGGGDILEKEIGRQAGETSNNADDEGPEGRGSRGTLPENTDKEEDGDGGGKISLHALEILVEIGMKRLDHQHPADAGKDDHRGGDAADQHLGFSGSVGMPLTVEVHREEGGGGIEFGSERGHECHDHAAGHDPLDAVGKDMGDHRGVGGVTIGAEARLRHLGQRKGDHARQEKDEDGGQLEVSGKNRSTA